MKIFKDIFDWKKFRDDLPREKSLGVVMTMGALHEGHLSLLQESKRNNDITVATIFLNPTQFDNSADLNKYPETWDHDIEVLEKLGIDFLVAPSYEQMYPDSFKYKVTENDLSKILCGASRQGHFDGVMTVVMKLLNIVRADKVYWGEKDYQQYLLVKGMAETFFINSEMIACPTIREKDGLAMSSRNLRLRKKGRKLAGIYAQIIRENKPLEEIRQQLEENGIKVDYLEEHFNRRFAAVFIEDIRLIDNVEMLD